MRIKFVWFLKNAQQFHAMLFTTIVALIRPYKNVENPLARIFLFFFYTRVWSTDFDGRLFEPAGGGTVLEVTVGGRVIARQARDSRSIPVPDARFLALRILPDENGRVTLRVIIMRCYTFNDFITTLTI